MIVADLKPVAEIAASLASFKRIHLLACGGCVSVCRSGGEAEAEQLSLELAHPRHFGGGAVPSFTVAAIERQCERDLAEAFLDIPEGCDAILSLACGVGVQMMADLYSPLPVLPALSTTFMGGATEPGHWEELCAGCGDCLLGRTGGICPIATCAKSLLNGPCGGSSGGICEIDDATPCAWHRIVDRLTAQNRPDLLHTTITPRDWRPAGHAGPRTRHRPALK